MIDNAAETCGTLDASSDPESRRGRERIRAWRSRRRLRVGPEMTMLVGRSIDDCI